MSSGIQQVVVMGVSGSGKSTVARELSSRLGFDFIEGDEHHPAANLAKMAAGIPLTDEDRLPWLKGLARILAEQHAHARSTVLACSALRRTYRDLLRTAAPGLAFIHLQAPLAVLEERMAKRLGHFMPKSLLRSQLDTLEPLEPDEEGVTLDATLPLETAVAQALELMRR